MSTRLIFSDLHFGDPDSSFSLLQLTDIKRVLSCSKIPRPVNELILAGDILDANISTLSRAIEGDTQKLGFRRWLELLHQSNIINSDTTIVYIPGNHDYVIWNYLGAMKAFLIPVSQGQILAGGVIRQAKFHNPVIGVGQLPEPFIRGVAPKVLWNNFIVVYPDYEFSLKGKNVLVTHGHYLDKKQTRFKKLRKLISKAQSQQERERVRNQFFSMTAQYQQLAHAISFTKRTRELADTFHKILSFIWDKIDIKKKLRGTPLDNKKLLKSIEDYLYLYLEKTPKPDIFIFGHTHECGYITKNNMDIWNCGSFFKKDNVAGSFIVVDNAKSTITLYEVSNKGIEREVYKKIY